MVGVLGIASAAQAKDLTGILGLNYTVGPAFLAGGSDAKDAGQAVGPGVGAALDLGLMHNLSFEFGYDYFDEGLQAQDLTFSGIVRLTPDSETTPFIGLGLGFGKRYVGDDWDRFALKAQGGIEHFFTDNISAAAVLSYNYINGPSDHDIGSLHMIEPGVRIAYYFGSIARH